MRYFLDIAYNGASFHGWQSQPNAVSVQSTIEEALSILLRNPVAITGAGRTDSGVHARLMYAHFDAQNPIEDKKRILLSLNRLTGKDILIRDIIPVADDAHARFDASSRTYKYFVGFHKNPFQYNSFWHSPSALDIEKMNEAAEILLEVEDFTSFAKLHSDAKTNICKVSEAIWQPVETDREALNFLGNLNEGIVFTITADRFLRNMVRAVVGTLVDVGRNKITLEDVKNIIERKDRCAAGTSMPANALFLWDIKYQYISISE